MRRIISRVETSQATGHIYCAPRNGSSVRRDVDPNKQQEFKELGSQESGSEVPRTPGDADNRTGNFPGAGRPDRSVKRHPMQNPKVDSIPSTADREKGEAPRRQIDAMHLILDPRLRGQVNTVVEDMGLDWDDLESVSYGKMMTPDFEPLERWQTEEREGMIIFRANTPAKQAQGLQYANQEQFPGNAVMMFPHCSGMFHMRNCKFPIDIAFTDGDMRVLGILRAKPGNDLYRAPLGTKHAIEAHPGFLRFNLGDVIPFK